MHVLFFVEEQSAEAALKNLLPKLLPEATFQLFSFQGKQHLLHGLPIRLRSYAWLTEDYRIVVLVDKDHQDCKQLKDQMEEAARSAGLISKSRAGNNRFQILNRIAVEELEAWFLSDVEALRLAYPRLPESLAEQQRFRDPDKVTGGTWETLLNLLRAHGYSDDSKIGVARKISSHMDPARNRSHSFQIFCQGLRTL